jgi:hypothetical protein
MAAGGQMTPPVARAWKHLSSFPCRDVREAFDLSQWRATSKGIVFKMGQAGNGEKP